VSATFKQHLASACAPTHACALGGLALLLIWVFASVMALFSSNPGWANLGLPLGAAGDSASFAHLRLQYRPDPPALCPVFSRLFLFELFNRRPGTWRRRAVASRACLSSAMVRYEVSSADPRVQLFACLPWSACYPGNTGISPLKDRRASAWRWIINRTCWSDYRRAAWEQHLASLFERA